jgi:3',5'-cyclic AMP phosphodiesterase CpdA
MKRNAAVIAAGILTGVICLLSVFAVGPGGRGSCGVDRVLASGSDLEVSKTEYAYDEPIIITARGSGKDWVGLYKPDGKASLLWVYVDEASGGPGSGNPFDILSCGVINDGSAFIDIKPGDYIIRLMPDDTSDLSRALKTIKITVTEGKETAGPTAPLSATFTKNEKTGEHVLGVTMPEGYFASDVQPYWSDGSAVLEQYTGLPKFKLTSGTVSYTYPAEMLIPEKASEIWVYSLNRKGQQSSECVKVPVPEAERYSCSLEPVFEFQVISDIHITLDGGHTHNVNFGRLLDDIGSVCPESSGIFIVGDMADSGNRQEYENMMEIYGARKGLPSLYLAIGNHDLYNGTLEDQTKQFLEYARLPDGKNPSSPHYDFWLGGFHFVFLGNDELVRGVDTTLSENTLKWLKNALEEDRNGDRPIFLFIHQSLYDTVAGSLPGQNWNGVVNDSELREILMRYPELIMFNGHSHWTMDSERNLFISDSGVKIFNTASTAYLWTSYNVITGENLDGSQGYYISVYADRIVVRGRDFLRGKWIPAAQYVFEGYEDLHDGSGSGNKKVDAGRIIMWSLIAAAALAICAAVLVALIRKKRV